MQAKLHRFFTRFRISKTISFPSFGWISFNIPWIFFAFFQSQFFLFSFFCVLWMPSSSTLFFKQKTLNLFGNVFKMSISSFVASVVVVFVVFFSRCWNFDKQIAAHIKCSCFIQNTRNEMSCIHIIHSFKWCTHELNEHSHFQLNNSSNTILYSKYFS